MSHHHTQRGGLTWPEVPQESGTVRERPSHSRTAHPSQRATVPHPCDTHQGGAWVPVPSPDAEENQGHLPELGVSEQIQGIPRGACLLWGQLGGRCRVRASRVACGSGPGQEGSCHEYLAQQLRGEFPLIDRGGLLDGSFSLLNPPPGQEPAGRFWQSPAGQEQCECGARSPRAPPAPNTPEPPWLFQCTLNPIPRAGPPSPRRVPECPMGGT